VAELGQPGPPPDWREWPELPLVSVLVAAWNEAEMIEQHIESFLLLDYPHKELILCAGGEDGTYEVARRHAGEGVVILEQRPGEGKQGALRRCHSQARGEIIYLTDADCILAETSFHRTLGPILEGREYVVTGDHRPLDRQLTNPLAVYQWYVNRYVAARTPDHVGGLKGANCAVRRDALERAGAFRDDVLIGTDYHLARTLLDAGYRIRYDRDSEVQTEYPDNIVDYRREHSRWTRNIIGHSLRFRELRAMLAGLLTVCVGSLMLLLPLSFVVIRGVGLVAWGLLYAHTYLSRMRYATFGKRRTGVKSTSPGPLGLAAYTWLDFFTWASAGIDLLAPRRRRRW